jgi:DNA-binding transcriptional ArsR family regulator
MFVRQMRTTRPIDVLFTRNRQAVLSALLLRPEKAWFLRELSRHLRLQPSSLQKELMLLAAAGIVSRAVEGRHVYFQAETSCPIFPELQRMLVKTTGVVTVLQDALKAHAARIDIAFVYGSLARAAEVAASDVDLMIIGKAGLFELTPALDAAQLKLARPVHATIYQPGDFAAKARMKHPFVRDVLAHEKLFVIGDADGLEATLRGTPRRAAGRKPAGARRVAPRHRA